MGYNEIKWANHKKTIWARDLKLGELTADDEWNIQVTFEKIRLILSELPPFQTAFCMDKHIVGGKVFYKKKTNKKNIIVQYFIE